MDYLVKTTNRLYISNSPRKQRCYKCDGSLESSKIGDNHLYLVWGINLFNKSQHKCYCLTCAKVKYARFMNCILLSAADLQKELNKL